MQVSKVRHPARALEARALTITVCATALNGGSGKGKSVSHQQSFNSIASFLLYTDPVVSDVWSFATGASLDVSGRTSKATCLSFVERVFIELPQWDAPVPVDDWADPVPYQTRARAREGAMSAEAELDSTDDWDLYFHRDSRLARFEERSLCGHPDAWVLRTTDGLQLLANVDDFKPRRVILEAFNKMRFCDRLQTWSSVQSDYTDSTRPRENPTTAEARATMRAYGAFIQRVRPTLVCCWTEQMLQHGLAEYMSPANRDIKLVNHVLLEDKHNIWPVDTNIRFIPPWAKTPSTMRSGYYAADSCAKMPHDLCSELYIRTIEHTAGCLCFFGLSDVWVHREDAGPGWLQGTASISTSPWRISITPWFPGERNPFQVWTGPDVDLHISDSSDTDLVDGVAAVSSARATREGDTAVKPVTRKLKAPTGSTASLPSPSASPEADCIMYSYDYDRYMQAWQDWCDKLNRTGNGKLVQVSLNPQMRCEGCDEDQPNPEHCVDHIDEGFIEGIFKILQVPKREKGRGDGQMSWRTGGR